MSASNTQRAFRLVCLFIAGFGGLPPEAAAQKSRKANPAGAAQTRENALIGVRIMQDGDGCRGVARLRPLHGKQLDMSRFVDIGYVTSFDSKPQLQAMGEIFVKGLTLDISGLLADMTKELKDRFVPIQPGRYAMTSITCNYGRSKSWIGSDIPNLFAAESGHANPVKGANVIDVRPGEILDAGTLEIRSDKVGFFETKTASVVASPVPGREQDELRTMFSNVRKRLRFSTFQRGIE
jgi:hypothetical protein